MDATTRWETEALREGERTRPSPPKPTNASRKERTNWVTLKEAEAATGIPVNTLRKWVRKSALPSYLESDGDIALRMVDLDAVRRRAGELGRTIDIQTTDLESTTDNRQQATDAPPAASRQPSSEPPASVPPSPAWEPEADAGRRTTDNGPTSDADEGATMMVPVDAWNKMLAQLGNLHEAGQQLAEARERAAKAETEAAFLRERLVEIREADQAEQPPQPEVEPSTAESTDPAETTDAGIPQHDPTDEVPTSPEASEPERTTTYWRYLTTGWRDRRRRGTD